MFRKASAIVITAASVTIGVVTFSAAGNAASLVLSDIQLDQITAGYNNLTGIWVGSEGATYYIRQVGNTIYWYGEHIIPNPNLPNPNYSPGNFSNVAYGIVDQTTGVVQISFVGVPKTADRGIGSLQLQISPDSRVMETTSSGTQGGPLFGGGIRPFRFTLQTPG